MTAHLPVRTFTRQDLTHKNQWLKQWHKLCFVRQEYKYKQAKIGYHHVKRYFWARCTDQEKGPR